MALPPARGIDPALGKRISAAALLGTLVVGDILLGGWFFAFFLLLAGVLMASEWARLAGTREPLRRRLVLWPALLLPMAAMLVAMDGSAGSALLLLALGAVVSGGLAALVPRTPVNRAAGGVLYIGLPAVSLLWLQNSALNGNLLVLWLFFVVWATDTFAYFVGRAVGGPRLAPRLSPSKTWAGLLGGMAGAAAVGGSFVLLHGGTMPWAALAGAALAVVAQMGDLFESWLKRRVDLKDSGDLIPGHGGLLDRVDGLLFAAPVFALCVLLAQAR